jgi:adenylate cyclase
VEGGLGSADLRRAAVPRLLAANALAAALTATAIELAEPTRAQSDSVSLRIGLQVVGTVVIVGVLSAVALRRSRSREQRLWRWLDEGRAPSPDERELVLGEPARVAFEIFRLWLVGAALVAVAFVAGDGFGRSAVAAATATVLGGITASTMSFFLAERVTRPALVLVLAGDPPRHARLSVRRRIVAAWVLGSGVPLAWIALVPVFRHPDSDVPLGLLTTVLAVSGAIAGAAIAYLTGSSVGGPIERVREGLLEVETGALDVAVTVDDPGDLGLLEAGFNRMVEAVATRTRLEDLLGRHVGADVARLALESGVQLGGETKDVSVLFVDVVGSTGLTARLPPAQVVAVLNRFFAAVVECVVSEGGYVNKFEGDAALCIFGAPVPVEDHAARALRAARSIRSSVWDVDLGIGVSTGTAVAGNIGSETRYEYTVIGQPVNEAARLVEQAKQRPARVLASAATVERADGASRGWRTIGYLELRGLQPLEVYEPAD